jgi:hypothetical protein
VDDVDNVDDLEVDGMTRQEDTVQVQLIQDPMNDDKGNSKIIHFIVSFYYSRINLSFLYQNYKVSIILFAF